MDYKKHYSVFYRECIDTFKEVTSTFESPLFADMTFGAGGHSLGIITEIANSKIVSVDQDPDAIKNGRQRIESEGFSERAELLKMNFESFPAWARENNKKFAGILMDLGVSSHQFDATERGFSFRGEAKLDMRMAYDEDQPSAYDIINEYDEEDIANIIYQYGEDRLSRRIAAAIVTARLEKPIETTKELENIIFHCYPKAQRFGKTHPATRTFQALRIYVNRELEVLENTLKELFDLLEIGGRLAVISFHSLEDRIVKHQFKEIVQNNKNFARILTKKPIVPTQEELDENSRSRSAKLRIIEKIEITTEGKNYGHKKKKNPN